MHIYELWDIIEVYDGKRGGKVEFVGLNYLLGCTSCKKTRIVKEETYERMVKEGLIHEKVHV